MIGYFPGREEYLWAEGIDLSREGLRCVSDQMVDPMTNLYFMLELERGGERVTIRCEGHVVHSRLEDGRCNFGVRIDTMSDDDRKLFEDYLVALETKQVCGDGDPGTETADDQGS